MAKDEYHYGLGRRKEASVTARIYDGNGQITVNGQPLEEYFGHGKLMEAVRAPLELLDKASDHDITLLAKGGGLSGQADAAKLAISNAFCEMNEDLRPTLKKAGFLTRDAREKERKKPGLKGARKAKQFRKR